MESLLTKPQRDDMLDGVLHWLNSSISGFSTPDETSLCDKSPEQIAPDLSRKAYTELGLALRLVQRCSTLAAYPEVQRLKEAWLDNLKQRNFFFDTRRRIQLFPHQTIACAVLKSFGEETEPIKQELQAVMDRNYMDRVERSAWEKLDMKYYTEAAGLNGVFPDYVKLYDSCMLRKLPSLSYIQKFDLYGLTHLLFHFSDFGNLDMRVFFGSDYEDIQAYVDSSLALSLVQQDWDLLAELLISQYCMNKSFNELDRRSARALKNIQQTDGFIPGREWVKNYQENPDFNHNDHDFKDVYHPTILGLFLLTLEMQN